MQAFAELNHGRWIVPCPNCLSAVYCDGRHEFALQWGGQPFRCIECGVQDVPVEYPADRLMIEQMVLGRPVDNQNWTHGESLSLLAGENVSHR